MTKFLKKAAAASRLSWVDDGGDMFIPYVYISCDRGLFDFVKAVSMDREQSIGENESVLRL